MKHLKNKLCFIYKFALCLFVSACVSGGSSKPAKFYDLSVNNDSIVSQQYNSSIGILRVQLPKFLDKPQIAVQNKQTQEVIFSEYNRWAESLSVLCTNAISENISSLLPNALIKNISDMNDSNRIINIDIIKLNAFWKDKGYLEAWYSIKDIRGKTICKNKFKEEYPISDNYESIAGAYSKLFYDLSKAIALSLVGQ